MQDPSYKLNNDKYFPRIYIAEQSDSCEANCQQGNMPTFRNVVVIIQNEQTLSKSSE